MRRLLMCLLTVVMVFSLIACGTTKKQSVKKEENTKTEETKIDVDENVVSEEDVTEEATQEETPAEPTETYSLYYIKADAESVGIVAFKNAEDISMDSGLLEAYMSGYGVKELVLPGSFEIVIPETIEGRKVVNIDMKAFDNCDSIISVEIPACCTNIEEGVFTEGCRDDLIIYGQKGSEAEMHAQEYGLTFLEK